MFSKKIKNFTLIILILTVSLSLVGSVFGAGLLASPPQFKYNLTSSGIVTGQLTVENIGDVPMNVVVDKKKLLMDSIHLVYSDNGIATWISFNPANFTLAPGESKSIYFTVAAPAKINYSDAVGALVIRGVPPDTLNGDNTNKTNLGVRQGIELVIPIVVGLPGPITESLELLEHKAPIVLLTFMPGDFIYQLNNKGTVYANMTGNIEISGLFGSSKIPIEGGVYPEDNYTLVKKWEPGFSDIGIYNAKTTINYGRYHQSQTLQTDDTILVIPVWLIIILIVAVMIWVIRKKEIESPVKIKIERKK